MAAGSLMAELRDLSDNSGDIQPGDIGGWVKSLQDYLDGKPSTYDPKQGVPVGYKVENGQVVKQSQWDQWGKGAALTLGGGIAGELGAVAPLPGVTIPSAAGSIADLGAVAPLGGATLPEVASGGLLPSTTIGSGAAAPISGSSGISTAASAGAGTGSGSSGMLSKVFGKGGLDPTTLLLGALSLFGGPQQQVRESFKSPGSITDPQQALYQALQGDYRLGAGLEQRTPPRLRSAYVQPGPAPVNIPGVPFQIGGGLGTDPALKDPSLLEGLGSQDVTQFGPFQGIAQDTFNKAGAPQPTKRRNP